MRPRPRLRRITGRAALAGGVLAVLTWMVSSVVFASFTRDRRSRTDLVIVRGGQVLITTVHDSLPMPDRDAVRWSWGWTEPSLRLGISHVYLPAAAGGVTLRTLRLPMWMPVLACAGVVAGTRWLEIRARRQGVVCARCGYSRVGLPADARCPECGTTSEVG